MADAAPLQRGDATSSGALGRLRLISIERKAVAPLYGQSFHMVCG